MTPNSEQPSQDPNAIFLACGLCSFCPSAGAIAVLILYPKQPVLALITLIGLLVLFLAGAVVWYRQRGKKAPVTSDICQNPEKLSQVVTSQEQDDGQVKAPETSETTIEPQEDVENHGEPT